MKLTPNALASLNWWLRHVITQQQQNYFCILLQMELGKLWEKKVYPKTGAVQQETKVKLDETQTLALSMSFLVWDIFDAPSLLYQSNLHSIFTELPRLRHDQETRFLPPTIATDE